MVMNKENSFSVCNREDEVRLFDVEKPLEEQPDAMELSRSNCILTQVTFLVMGTTAVILWNNYLSILPSVRQILFPNLGNFTDIATGTYFVVLFVVTSLLVFYPCTASYTVFGSLLGIMLSCVFLIFTCTVAPESIVVLFFYIFTVLAAVFSGVLICACFSISSITPHSCVASASAGSGLSGLFSAFVWILLAYAISNEKAPSVIRMNITLQLVISIVLCMVSWTLFYILLSRRFMRSLLGIQKQKAGPMLCDLSVYMSDFKNLMHTTFKEKEDFFLASGRKAIFLKSFNTLLVRSFVFFETMLVFPTIAPIAWRCPVWENDVLIMTYQVVDFLGRYAVQFIKFLLVSEKILLALLGARLLLSVFLIVMVALQSIAFFAHIAFKFFLMLIFAFTNGWLATASSVRLPGRIEGVLAKIIASNMGLSFCFACVAVGQFLGKMIKSLI